MKVYAWQTLYLIVLYNICQNLYLIVLCNICRKGSIVLDFAVIANRDLTPEEKSKIAVDFKVAVNSGLLDFTYQGTPVKVNSEVPIMVAHGDGDFG